MLTAFTVCHTVGSSPRGATLRCPCRGVKWTGPVACTSCGSGALVVLVVLAQTYSSHTGPGCGSGVLLVLRYIILAAVPR